MGIKIKEWILFNKLEDFYSLLNSIDKDFTQTGNLCYTNDNSEKLSTIHLQEFYNLRWLIQHLIDNNGYEYGDHGNFSPLCEYYWIFQTNEEFMKYVILTLQRITPEQLKMNHFKPIIKVNTNEELDIDEGKSTKDEQESTTSAQLSEENSTSDISTDDKQESISIETSQGQNILNKTTYNEADSPIAN